MEVENGRFNYRVIIDMLIKKLNTSIEDISFKSTPTLSIISRAIKLNFTFT